MPADRGTGIGIPQPSPAEDGEQTRKPVSRARRAQDVRRRRGTPIRRGISAKAPLHPRDSLLMASPKSAARISTPTPVESETQIEWLKQATLIPEHLLRELFPTRLAARGATRSREDSRFRTNPSVRRVGPSHTRIRTQPGRTISWSRIRWANDNDRQIHLSKKNHILGKTHYYRHNHH